MHCKIHPVHYPMDLVVRSTLPSQRTYKLQGVRKKDDTYSPSILSTNITFNDGAQFTQQQRCPQGKKTTPT